MVRPTQERETIALTDLQSLAIGSGSVVGDGGVDLDGGGTNPDDGGGDGDQAGTEVYTIIDSGTWSGLIDYGTARWWDITLTTDTAITVTGAPAEGLVGRLHIVLRQGPGAPFTVTWPAAVLWRDTDGTEGGPAPTLATVEDALDALVLTTFDGGTTWGGTYDTGDGSSTPVDLPWFNVEDYGAVHDGSTDDASAIQDTIDAAEAAGGGVVFFPMPAVGDTYIIGGALQDTGRSNSQLVLPIKDYIDDEAITIELRGEIGPAVVPSVIGATPLNTGVVLQSTLGSGTGAVIGGWGPAGSVEDFSNIKAVFRDLTVRTVTNPTNSGIDLSHVANCRVQDVQVDAGSYNVAGYSLQTTATSYGIQLPRVDNGATVELAGAVNVIGFYNGYLVGEHTSQRGTVAAWACRNAFKFPFAHHASHFERIAFYHCINGLFGVDDHHVAIEQLNIEHAASGTWVPSFDIYDPSDFLIGHILGWHVVLAGTGVDHTFTVNSAANIFYIELGDDPFASSIPAFASPTITLADTPATGAAGTIIRSDATIVAFNDSSDPTDEDFGDNADPGVSDFAARRDHLHGMPAEPSGGGSHFLVIADGHSTPLIFGDLVQTEAGDDLVYTD